MNTRTDPTPEQIAKRTAEVQATERFQRRQDEDAKRRYEPWTPPVIEGLQRLQMTEPEDDE